MQQHPYARDLRGPRLTRIHFVLISIALLVALAAPGLAGAQITLPEDDADTVYLRKNCRLEADVLPNCVQHLNALDAWIWNVRRPSEANPLVIHIGPGMHNGTFYCPDQTEDGGERAGWVSVIGSGRGITRIGNTSNPFSLGALIYNCEGLAFSHLSLEGNAAGVNWSGGGSATWTDVDLSATKTPELVSLGWTDSCTGEGSEQSFFGASIRGFGATQQAASAAYRSACAHSKFYGGDIQLLITNPDASTVDGPQRSGGAVALRGQAELEVYGTSIRVGNSVALNDASSAQEPETLYGVTVKAFPGTSDTPRFRMHGGIISMNSKSLGDTHLVGLRVIGDPTRPADQNAYANTAGTAFVLNPGGAGLAERLRVSDAQVDAPLLWQAGANPPSSKNGDLGSTDGQGLFVETDCDATGACSAGDQSHLMVYDTSCAAGGPWRDVMTNACRAD
ncbi:MAG: hypothetical protein AB8G23_11240 [Myxococcota bacterium]